MRFGCKYWLTAIGAAAMAWSVALQPANAANAANNAAIEPKALEIIEAASKTLAAARTMSFTARSMHQVAGPTDAPVYLTTESRVVLERPDKLRVLTEGDGTAIEFYYGGASMTALDRELGFVATSDAPPTIDDMLVAAAEKAGIFFPFDDVIISDPGKSFREGLVSAIHVGQSKIVGGVVTDMIVVSLPGIHGQLWIGADDKLLRMVRVKYPMLPGGPDFMTIYSDWKIDPSVDAATFAPPEDDGLVSIEFGKIDQ